MSTSRTKLVKKLFWWNQQRGLRIEEFAKIYKKRCEKVGDEEERVELIDICIVLLFRFFLDNANAKFSCAKFNES